MLDRLRLQSLSELRIPARSRRGVCQRYRNQQYQVLINARTGEVQGDRPYSTVKIALAVLAGVLLAAIIFALVLYLQ